MNKAEIKTTVSIIISCFNKESLIWFAVNSALKQSYSNCEVIVVDDGSTDGSHEILKKLNEKYPQLIILTQENSGLSEARNTGLRASSGEYILFHDGDDILFENAVEKLVDDMNSITPQPDIIGGIFERYVNDIPRKVKAFQDNSYAVNFYEDPQILWKHYSNFSACNKLFRRKFLTDNNLEFAPNLYMQDIDFWLHATQKAKGLRFTSIVVSTYMHTIGSWSSQRTEKRFQSFLQLAERLDLLKHQLNIEARAAIDSAFIQGAGLFFMRWKLLEYKNSSSELDLEKISRILQNIPLYSLAKYSDVKNNIIPAITFLIRSQRYSQALELIEFEKSFTSKDLKREPISNGNEATFSPWLEKHVISLQRKISDRKAEVASSTQNTASISVNNQNYSEPSKPENTLLHNGNLSLNILVFGLGNLYQAGGVQLSYKHLFKYLVQKGHKVSFFSHWKEQTDNRFFYDYDDRINFGFYKLADRPESIENIRNIAQTTDPDVILIVNSSQNALILASALHDLPFPVILSERGGADHCLEHSWATKTQRQVAHAVVDFSHLLMESYHSAVHSDLTDYVKFIPSGVSMTDQRADRVNKGTQGYFTILYTGRLAFEKDLDILIQAFLNLTDRFPDWQLKITGDGPERVKLEELASTHPNSSNIIFTGNIQDVDELGNTYKEATIFVLPSRAEGCPLSLREAFGYGLPSIGFQSCSGTNEIIRNGINGLLAEPGDKVASLEKELFRLMSAPELRVRLGDQAAIDAKQYSLESVCSRTERLLFDASQWRKQRTRLRDFKKNLHRGSFLRLDKIHKIMIDNKRTRNVYAFSMSARLYELNDANLSYYCSLFGSCLFDWQWYLKSNPKIKLSGKDPLTHYLTVGWKKGLAPSAEFDPKYYRKRYMNRSKETCPLVHFYNLGRFKGARTSRAMSPKIVNQIISELRTDIFHLAVEKNKNSWFIRLFGKEANRLKLKHNYVSKGEFRKIFETEIIWSRLPKSSLKLLSKRPAKLLRNKRQKSINLYIELKESITQNTTEQTHVR